VTVTKHGISDNATEREIGAVGDPATSETLIADSTSNASARASAPAVGRAGSGERPRRGDSIGRFVVLGVLGEGGMGVVYSAYDPHLDRKVAIKVLRPDVMSVGDAHARLLREAQAMAKIDHPNVVHVHEVGMLGEQVYVAMEFCDGGTLRAWLTTTRTRDAIIECFVQAGRGLAAAHAAGLVHRDFKPDNVLLAKDHTVRVTDFGLVTLVAGRAGNEPLPRAPTDRDRELITSSSQLSENLTRTGSIMGTPTYMAPEQFEGHAATPRTDQFALCVALYEAVYGVRPFEGTTFGELRANVLAGKLAPVPKTARVPAALRRSLLRGLAVEPDARFPSMIALLAALAPAQRRWPLALLGGGLAAVGGGAAVWLATSSGNAATRCASEASERIAGAWSPATAANMRAQFDKSGRSYADTAAAAASSALDRYASRWHSLADDVCEAEHATSALPELVVRRRGCLDAGLDALRGVVTLLASSTRPEFVDHARDVVDGLPDLGDCSDEAALLAAPGMPPAAQAVAITELDRQLDVAAARSHAGEYRAAADDAANLVKRADAIGWPPLQTRAHIVAGMNTLAMLAPARAELAKAGELATANHLDRDAVRAWSGALFAAGTEHAPDAFAMLESVARGAAAGTRDRLLAARVEVDRARAIVRLHRWREGAEACRTARKLVEQLDSAPLRSDARACIIEALVSLGAFTELAPLIAEALAETTRELGADHPRVTDFMLVQVTLELKANKLDEALRDAQRVLAIRERVYPAKHYKLIEATHALGGVYEARGDDTRAQELYAQALAISDPDDPTQTVQIAFLHNAIGMYQAGQRGDDHHAQALAHLQQAIDLTRAKSGSQAVELGLLLLEYGQVKSEDDVDQALAILREGRDILIASQDKRAGGAATTMAIVTWNAQRYADARDFAQDALTHLDADAPASQIAVTKETLASALAKTHGDRARYLELARDAKQLYEQMGPRGARNASKLAKFIATH
jgi:tetratricopeptide (TPR) repeat protein